MADAIDAARVAYLEGDPRGDVAADVHYRLGLSRLFHHRDLGGAAEHFRLASQEKGAPIVAEARVSLALCLRAQQKYPQAIFELRKLLPQGAKPSPQTAMELDFLALLLRASSSPAAEVAAVDMQRIEHLQALAQTNEPKDKAHFLLRLAAAHADVGTAAARALARTICNDVVKLGASAGESTLLAARSTLKDLAK